MNKNIDELDLNILKLLQNDARVPYKTIAEKLSVSVPTITARVKTLTEKGIIKGFYTEIDRSLMGEGIKAYIDMEVPPAAKEELYAFLKCSPQVSECHRVTGGYSLLIKAFFKNTADMDKFLNELQRYGRTQTQIVFSSIIEHRGMLS